MGKGFYGFLAVLFLNMGVVAYGAPTKKSGDCVSLLKPQVTARLGAAEGSGAQVDDFSASYIKNVQENPITAEQKAAAHPVFDYEPLSLQKLEFIRKRSSLLNRMISRGELTMQELRVTKIFDGEIYRGDKYSPYAHVMILPDRVLTFDFKNFNSVEELNAVKIGFLSEHIQLLRLDRKHILTLANGRIELQSALIKDPELLTQGRIQVPAGTIYADIIEQHSQELAGLLMHTDFTIETFSQAAIAKGTVNETGANLYIFVDVSNGSIYYISDRPGAIDTTDTKKFGAIEPKKLFGFSENTAFTITFADGNASQFLNGIAISEFHKDAANVEASLAAKAKSSKENEKVFINTFKKALKDLIMNEVLSSQLHELRTLVQVKHPVTGNKFAVLATAKGYVAFDPATPDKWSYLRDVDKTRPLRWEIGNGFTLTIRESIGFLKTDTETIQGP